MGVLASALTHTHLRHGPAAAAAQHRLAGRVGGAVVVMVVQVPRARAVQGHRAQQARLNERMQTPGVEGRVQGAEEGGQGASCGVCMPWLRLVH